jgi:putative intracellular protease/amidase
MATTPLVCLRPPHSPQAAQRAPRVLTHDIPETAIPWRVFKSAGFDITFATQSGSEAACDSRMLKGTVGALLGAPRAAKQAYAALEQADEFKNPSTWDAVDLTDYDCVFLPGGHDKAILPIIESSVVQKALAAYFPLTQRTGENGKRKTLAAICHGVQVLSNATYENGKSVIHDARTTALTGFFETAIYHSTRLWLGDYYKTMGAGTPNVEDIVKKKLDSPNQFVVSRNPAVPYVEPVSHYPIP